MVFCNIGTEVIDDNFNCVTILILIDGFLQLINMKILWYFDESHNPYFNRWFSAIERRKINSIRKGVTILILIDGFLQLV